MLILNVKLTVILKSDFEFLLQSVNDVVFVLFQKKAIGGLLYEKVCDHLDLLEKEYFALTYRDDLDPNGTQVRLLYEPLEVSLT